MYDFLQITETISNESNDLGYYTLAVSVVASSTVVICKNNEMITCIFTSK